MASAAFRIRDANGNTADQQAGERKFTYTYNHKELSRDLRISKKAGGLCKMFKRCVGDIKDEISGLNLDEEDPSMLKSQALGDSID